MSKLIRSRVASKTLRLRCDSSALPVALPSACRCFPPFELPESTGQERLSVIQADLAILDTIAEFDSTLPLLSKLWHLH